MISQQKYEICGYAARWGRGLVLLEGYKALQKAGELANKQSYRKQNIFYELSDFNGYVIDDK
jgi:hypothetical protein